jgi:hypothetical protein
LIKSAKALPYFWYLAVIRGLKEAVLAILPLGSQGEGRSPADSTGRAAARGRWAAMKIVDIGNLMPIASTRKGA